LEVAKDARWNCQLSDLFRDNMDDGYSNVAIQTPRECNLLVIQPAKAVCTLKYEKSNNFPNQLPTRSRILRPLLLSQGLQNSDRLHQQGEYYTTQSHHSQMPGVFHLG
jgi:hypothetical protein